MSKYQLLFVSDHSQAKSYLRLDEATAQKLIYHYSIDPDTINSSDKMTAVGIMDDVSALNISEGECADIVEFSTGMCSDRLARDVFEGGKVKGVSVYSGDPTHMSALLAALMCHAVDALHFFGALEPYFLSTILHLVTGGLIKTKRLTLSAGTLMDSDLISHGVYELSKSPKSVVQKLDWVVRSGGATFHKMATGPESRLFAFTLKQRGSRLTWHDSTFNQERRMVERIFALVLAINTGEASPISKLGITMLRCLANFLM